MKLQKNSKFDFNQKRDEGITGKVLFGLYGINRPIVRRLILKLMWNILGKHHQFYSKTLRRIFKEYHGVEIGMYTHGFCFQPGAMPPGTRIGRYCSIAYDVLVHDANHPMNTRSTHAFFFNPELGYIDNHIIKFTHLVIGNDVWIGQSAIMLPSCEVIEDGAVIGAGSVVNKNIPPYAVAIGHPSKIVRYRFSEEKIQELKASKWWEKSIDELSPEIGDFCRPLEGDEVR